ncbi:MAG: hypothetical protein KatS3mg031_1307 [Chitinophagales bacterium]|nr:MAG: hypothetical protein KatS3mg031_1307 [Chitinophagales bacterium]
MRKLLIFLCMVGVAVPVLAQAPPPSAVPLDPASWLLLAGGGVLVGKKIYDSANKKEL